jgi:Ca-activated chloride channel family protein
LATDGDFNVGLTDEGGLVRLIQEKAKQGVFLSALGFGMGNYKDSMLEMLADKGNGNYAFNNVGSTKGSGRQMNSTLITVAMTPIQQIQPRPSPVPTPRSAMRTA